MSYVSASVAAACNNRIGLSSRVCLNMVAQLVSSHLIILKFRHYEVCFSVCGKERQSYKLTMSLDQLLDHPTHCT